MEIAVFADVLTSLLAYVTHHGVMLAAGFIALFSVYYLFAGFMNKAMPQLMVTFIGIPFVAMASIFFWNKTSTRS